MRFSKGLWDNEYFKDVYMNVIKVQYIGPNYTKMKVTWWHRNGYPITTERQIVKIYKKHYKYWSIL